MRIVIDMQGAQTESRFRGIGRYTLAFARAVARNRGAHDIMLALSGLLPEAIAPIRSAFRGLLPEENIRVWHAPGPVCEREDGNETRRAQAELLYEAFLASLDPDIVHVCSLFEGFVDDAVTSIGRLGHAAPVSVTVHDLIPLLNPGHYLRPGTAYTAHYLRKIEHLERASLYLAVSDSARREGVNNLQRPAPLFINTGEAAEPQFRPIELPAERADGILRALGIGRKFVLYTGGCDERKNLKRLIEAYALLPADVRDGHQLVLAGSMPPGDVAGLMRRAREAALCNDEVVFTGYISDDDLVALYTLCQLYVFPSWHEGFGLPALEAASCGAPVIGANTSSLPEVIGLDRALFDPFDTPAMAAKMVEALTDEPFRRSLRQHGLRQAAKFSWDVTAERAISAWERLHTEEGGRISAAPRAAETPRLAFVSPFPPARTGIADYSAELLPALAAHYRIDLIVAEETVDMSLCPPGVAVHDVAWLRAHAGAFERVLYQVGNSPFHWQMLGLLEEIPGIVVLHDFYISALMAWLERDHGAGPAWTEALYASHGYMAVEARYRDPEEARRAFPANWPLLRQATGVIVHSEYSRNLARQWYGGAAAGTWHVIPHLRRLAALRDRAAAKARLGFAGDDFVVCSFGFLDAVKLNDRLLTAWLGSALAGEGTCHLVFVGENHGGDFGAALSARIAASGLAPRIRITGFAAPDLYRLYLSAADVAVQLRTSSRGETSGTVLDCMGEALPVIVNANGSMAELDDGAVWMLPEDFTDAALAGALEALWRDPARRQLLGANAREVVRLHHAPARCAALYAAAIEAAGARATTGLPALVRAVAAETGAVASAAELERIAAAIAANLPARRPARRLFVDVTATSRNDLKTGIERAARALTLALILTPPETYRVEPVYLCADGGRWHYCFARAYTLRLLGCPEGGLADAPIDPQVGDVVLIADIAGRCLVDAEREGLFAAYRQQGVQAYAIVHDLLPIRLPEVFPPGAAESHAAWLRAICTLDGAICVSRTVADDLASWRREAGIVPQEAAPFRIGWSHHGADIINSAHSVGLPEDADSVLQQMAARPSFLMVGTVEPRKAHRQAIEAFDILWEEGEEINLIIVGKEGWQDLPDALRRDLPQTAALLRSHPQRGRRLFWLEGISDEYLDCIYAASTCLIAASLDEGFGLPLIEAAERKLPVLARDIAVFREVVGAHAHYFRSRQPEGLAWAVATWLRDYRAGRHAFAGDVRWRSWSASAQSLWRLVQQWQGGAEAGQVME